MLLKWKIAIFSSSPEAITDFGLVVFLGVLFFTLLLISNGLYQTRPRPTDWSGVGPSK